MTKQELLETIREAEENRDKLIRQATQYEIIISELYNKLKRYDTNRIIA